ncbi:MAG TPA: Maf family protein [Gammaproteobacteria bacterium]
MLYLASKSPRRRELLQQIRVEFECLDVDVPETPGADEKPQDYAVRVAQAKAKAGYARLNHREAWVLGADTVVTVDGHILGKPQDRSDALRMLARLSGRTHTVITAVALIGPAVELLEVSRSEVTFREINAEEQELYWQCGEPLDKAGGYAIQGIAAVFVKHLSGSYSGVVGLPLYETGKLLTHVSTL